MHPIANLPCGHSCFNGQQILGCPECKRIEKRNQEIRAKRDRDEKSRLRAKQAAAAAKVAGRVATGAAKATGQTASWLAKRQKHTVANDGSSWIVGVIAFLSSAMCLGGYFNGQAPWIFWVSLFNGIVFAKFYRQIIKGIVAIAVVVILCMVLAGNEKGTETSTPESLLETSATHRVQALSPSLESSSYLPPKPIDLPRLPQSARTDQQQDYKIGAQLGNLKIDGVTEGVTVTFVAPASAAEIAGLQVRDNIIAVNGQDVATNIEVADKIRTSNGKTLQMLVKRDHELLELAVNPVSAQ